MLLHINSKLIIIKIIAINNSYKADIIDKLINNEKKNIWLNKFYVTQKEQKRLHLINYVPNKRKKICSDLQKLEIKIICVNISNLGRIFTINQEKCNVNKQGYIV